jgi:hypothetical protein
MREEKIKMVNEPFIVPLLLGGSYDKNDLLSSKDERGKRKINNRKNIKYSHPFLFVFIV